MPTFKDRPCPTCGTVKYRKTDDGGYVCKHGHQMVGYIEEHGDEEALIGVRTTKRKRVQNIDEQTQRLYGAELEDAFKRLFQFSLQVMSRSFVTDLGFPPEFEYVVRELWLLYIHDSKLELLNAHTVNNNHRSTKLDTNAFMSTEEPEDLLDESDDSDCDIKPNIKVDHSDTNLSNENTDTIKQYRDDDDTKTTAKPTPSSKERAVNSFKWPQLQFGQVIVFCFIAGVYLGWPITLSDLRRWCKTMRLPYLRIFQMVPSETLDMLDLRLLNGMTQVPSIARLRRDTVAIINAFKNRCGLALPEYNAAPLIYRYCTQMYLPVEVYFCARELHEKYAFFKHRAHTTQLEYGINYHDIDTRIMALVLFMANMLYDWRNDDDSEPHYENPTLPPPLSKEMWIKHIQANADRWEEIDRSKMVDSPDPDLAFIVNYLKETTSHEKYLARKEKKSLARRFISRLRDDLVRTKQHYQALSDLLLDTPCVSSTHDPIKTEQESNGDIKVEDSGAVIGDRYHYYRDRAEMYNSKLRYAKIHEVVVKMACRICDCPFDVMNSRLMSYERSMIREFS